MKPIRLKSNTITIALISAFLISAMICSSNNAHAFGKKRKAHNDQDEKYFTIASEEIVELEDQGFGTMGNLDYMALEFDPELPSNFHIMNPVSTVEGIITIGSKIWKIIEANKPVVNVVHQSASALPQGVDSWLDLENWQPPVSKVYMVKYKNLYGMEVVRYSFRVMFTHSGQFNGKGRYISKVSAMPADLAVSWGYTFNSEAVVGDTVNLGTLDSPVAGMELTINWKVDTVMRHMNQSETFFVTGDGRFDRH